VAGAALDGIHLCAGHLEHFLGLLADVLHARVAGHVVRDLAQRHLEVGLQQAILVAQHEVFEGIVHRGRNGLAARILREQQRQSRS
jgi:hypothetical protein